MNIAEKYMYETKNKQFRFIPPKFDKKLFRNDKESVAGGVINNPFDGNLENENLYPGETSKDQLYCYYNEIGDCYNGNNKSNSNYNPGSMSDMEDMKSGSVDAVGDIADKYMEMGPRSVMPLPSDILKNFNLDLDEEKDLDENRADADVNRIYSEIEANNPNVMSVFSDYQIPLPLAKVIAKRIVKLSLQYYHKEDR